MRTSAEIDRRKGFTLVESMISLAILTIAVAMAASSFSRVAQTTVASAACGDMHQDMRMALHRMSRDVQAAKSVCAVNDDYYFGVIVDNAGVDEYIYYLAYNDKLYRVTAGGSDALAENVENLNVELRDLSGDVVTDLDSAYLINITLVSKVDSRGGEYGDQVETLIRLRNK